LHNASEDIDKLVEKRILEDLKISSYNRPPTTPVRNPRRQTPSPVPTPLPPPINSDGALVSSMASRLAKLEDQVRIQQQQLHEKDKTIADLLSKLNEKRAKEADILKVCNMFLGSDGFEG
jgi:hypothetical protein